MIYHRFGGLTPAAEQYNDACIMIDCRNKQSGLSSSYVELGFWHMRANSSGFRPHARSTCASPVAGRGSYGHMHVVRVGRDEGTYGSRR